MWGVAVLAHLAGNWRYGDVWPEPTLIGVALAAVGLVGTALVVAPRRWSLLALAGLIPVTAVLEAPVLGNHWVLAGLVSLAYLAAGGRWDRFEPAARVIVLVFYSFAAFAKLNSGFLDPETSCGVFYANQWLAGYGLGPLPAESPAGRAAAWGSAVVELAIPALLVIRRTRPWGVAAAVAFHGLVSLDLGQHFYDFTAVLLPLFVLFLPDSYAERFEALGEALRPRLRRLLVVVAGFVGVAVTVANVTPLTNLSLWWLQVGSFLWWAPYLAVVAWAVAGSLRPVALDWRPAALAWVVVVLAFLNGLTPYLEVKTAYGWNMYSNLVTVDGESNHLLIPTTLPLREGQSGLVRVVATDDAGLQAYIDAGYLLPWPSFVSYLAERPQVAVTYERYGRVVELERAGDFGFDRRVRWWWRWLPFRAVHADEPQRCQPSFLPAL